MARAAGHQPVRWLEPACVQRARASSVALLRGYQRRLVVPLWPQAFWHALPQRLPRHPAREGNTRSDGLWVRSSELGGPCPGASACQRRAATNHSYYVNVWGWDGKSSAPAEPVSTVSSLPSASAPPPSEMAAPPPRRCAQRRCLAGERATSRTALGAPAGSIRMGTCRPKGPAGATRLGRQRARALRGGPRILGRAHTCTQAVLSWRPAPRPRGPCRDLLPLQRAAGSDARAQFALSSSEGGEATSARCAENGRLANVAAVRMSSDLWRFDLSRRRWRRLVRPERRRCRAPFSSSEGVEAARAIGPQRTAAPHELGSVFFLFGGTASHLGCSPTLALQRVPGDRLARVGRAERRRSGGVANSR